MIPKMTADSAQMPAHSSKLQLRKGNASAAQIMLRIYSVDKIG